MEHFCKTNVDTLTLEFFLLYIAIACECQFLLRYLFIFFLFFFKNHFEIFDFILWELWHMMTNLFEFREKYTSIPSHYSENRFC